MPATERMAINIKIIVLSITITPRLFGEQARPCNGLAVLLRTPISFVAAEKTILLAINCP